MLGGVPVPSFDAVRLAVCQTTSRAYGFGPDELERVALDGGGAGAEGVSSMLVPGVDLCNHAHPPVHTAHWLDARGAHPRARLCLARAPLPGCASWASDRRRRAASAASRRCPPR